MAMRGKMRSEGGGRRRTRSKSDDSDASDDDYKIEDDGEFEDSDEYCSSLAGEELEDDLARGTRRLKRRNSFLSKSKGRARKVSKERKISYEEDGDEDFVEDDDNVDEEEIGKNWATGFPKRKRNAVPKAAKKKKASYTEENDEDEGEDNDQDDDDNGNEDDKDLQKVVPSRKQNGVQKAVKENKSAYMEENDDDNDDDDYEAEDDAVDEDDDYYGIEDEKDKRKGCPSRKQNRVRKTLKKKKACYMEESDDNYEAEEDSGDDVEDCNSIEDEKKIRKGCAGRKKNGVAKARKKKVYDTEESDDNYEAEDDECDDDDNEDEKDLQNGCLGRKQNGVQKELKEKKVMEENDDEYEAEDDECDGYNDIGDEKVLQNGFPGRKQNGVQKARKEKKASYTEESDDDYEAEDDECDEDDDYNDIEDEQDLPNVYPDRKPNGDKKVLKKKVLYTEEDDDDHEAAGDDECDEDTDNGIEKDGCSSRKQYGVQKALKENKASYTEENDDDYKAEDNEFNDDDDYDNAEEEESEEEELEVEDDDEDFTPNEIDFDDEDEFPVEEKAKRVGRTHSQGKRCLGGRKRRKRSTIKSKTKEPAKRRGFQRKSSTGRCKKVKKSKSCVKETNERNFGRKRRRLLVDSDSDFVDSKPLLLDQEYTISEEEREQVREANKFCGNLTVALRNCSSNKRSVEEENLHQERKQKARKGKDKLEGLKLEVAKQVCGICFSEEGKRTVRGTLDCCSHYFCFNCIMEWSKVESRCPLCKQRFATISKPARSDTSFDLRTTVVAVPERDQVYQPSEEELRSYLDPYENVICTECHHGGDDANMLLCDLCDSPAHTYCVGLSEVPEGNWYCEGCRPTALGPSNPQTPNLSRDRRTTNDLFARSSSPSANIRETIDLNRVYEPETPLFEGTGMSSSPRPVNGDLQAGSSIPGGAGVQTVRERRRRHQQMAHFVGRNVANIGLGPEVEWGRTRRLGFQNSIRPETSSIYDIFSQGPLHDNFTSPVPSMRLLPATPSHSRIHRAFGQTLTGVNGSPDGSGSLQAGLSGITGGDAWSFHGHPSMQ